MRPYRWAAAAALGMLLLMAVQGMAQEPSPAASQPAKLGDALRKSVRGALNAVAAPVLQAASAPPGNARPADAVKAAAAAAAASAITTLANSRVPAASAPASSARVETFPVPDPTQVRVTLYSDQATMPALQLRYTTVALPAAREGADYPPRALVIGGASRLAITTSPLPPGLALSSDGLLKGQPAAGSAGTWTFTLEVRDGTGQLLRQAYALDVLPTRKPPGSPAVKPAVPPLPLNLSKGRAAEAEPGSPIESITIYKLETESLNKVLQAWVAGTTSDTGGAVAASPAASEAEDGAAIVLPFSIEELQAGLRLLGLPLGQQGQAKAGQPTKSAAPPDAAQRQASLPELQQMFQPLLDLEFPTLALFEAAVREQQCELWQQKWTKAVTDAAAKAEPRTAPATPPTAPDCRKVAAEPAGNAPRDSWTLKAIYDSYLPAALLEALRNAARLPMDLAPSDKATGKPKPPVAPTLTSTDCGCVRWQTDDDVVALMPFWHGSAQDVELSHVQRLQIFAAVLQDDGSLIWPAAWKTPAGLSELALKTQRHDVRFDLVVHRQDWVALLRSPYAERFIAGTLESVENALKMPAPKPMPRGVLPLWNPPSHLFDGVVLWLEPEAGMDAAAFRSLYRSLVSRLHATLHAMGRPLQLTLVVPSAQFGLEDTAYGISDLTGYVEGRFTGVGRKLVPAAADEVKPDYEPVEGQTTVRLLLLLDEATTLSKKTLRAQLDRTHLVTGSRRVNLIDHIDALTRLPVHPGPRDLEPRSQLDDDLAYYQWVYRGASFWPLPEGANGSKVMARVREHFSTTLHWSEIPVVCDFVCPRRAGLHLLMEGLLLACLVAAAVWRFTDWAQNRGPSAKLLLLSPALVTPVLGYGLVSCDPELRQLRQGGILPALFFMVAILLTLWLTMRRRITPP